MERGDASIVAAMGLLSAALCAGCTPARTAETVPQATDVASGVAPGVAPGVANGVVLTAEQARTQFESIVTAHNTRAARLETLESRASLELRYSDADGDHFDQCEADVFLASGGRGALRATKVGSNLLWVGSDGKQGWIFRLDRQPTSLTVFDDIGATAPGQRLAGEGAAEFSLLAPACVRALAALGAIPMDFTLRAVASPTAEGARFEVCYPIAGGAEARVRFAADGLPAAVRLFAGADRPAENVIVSAELSEYTPAQAENLSQGAWPKVPRRIVASMPGSGRFKAAEARLYLDAPIAMARRMKPRFFVLDELVAQLRPDAVEHVVGADGGDAAK